MIMKQIEGRQDYLGRKSNADKVNTWHILKLN